MTIDINKNSALIDSAASGYSGCGCGNRRYYTKAEIDEMLKDVLDPEQIKQILDQMFDEYIEGGELEQLIINAIAGLYTNEEIDDMLEELEARMKTWSGEQGYLKDITLTINGTPLHNNSSIVIEGGGGEPVDISGKLDTSAFTAYTSSTETWKNNMEDCCDEANFQIRYLMNQIIYLQKQIDELKGDTGSTGSTEYVEFVFNVLSTTEPAWIAEDSVYPHYDKMIIDDGPEIDFNPRYTFSTTGIHRVRLRLIHPDNMDKANEIVWAGTMTTSYTHCYLIEYYVPDTVESMSLHMQERNDKVEKITLYPTTPPVLSDLYEGHYQYSFNEISLFYVPAQSLNAYKTAKGWSTVADRFRAIE